MVYLIKLLIASYPAVIHLTNWNTSSFTQLSPGHVSLIVLFLAMVCMKISGFGLTDRSDS